MSRWINVLWMVCLAAVLTVGCSKATEDGTTEDTTEAAAAQLTSNAM